MRTSSFLAFLAFAGWAMTLFGAAQFVASFKAPPKELTVASGAIDEVNIQTSRVTKSEARFRLQGDDQFFSHPLFYPKYYWLSEQIAPGKQISLKYRQGNRSDLWALQLDEDVVLTERDAAVAHRRDGYIGLGLSLIMFIAACVLFRGSRDLAMKGE